MWLAARGPGLSSEEREAVLARLFFEGSELAPYLRRFATLMALSTIIASLGLVADSPAVVIGAMLVAPLMTPILALAASLVTAWPRRQLTAALLVAGGCAWAVGVAWLVATLLPPQRFVELPGELLGRTSPALIDLGIGLAAGAAGAYVTVRSKAASALPGAAIAVALVPPLAAVGILLQLGENELAGSAALLFLTNLATITLSASVVFLATGFTPAARIERRRHRIRLGVVSALLAVAVVAYPLARQSVNLIDRQNERSTISDEVERWLSGRDTEIDRTQLAEDDRFRITVDLVGSSAPPAAEPLAAAIARELNHPVTLTVRYTHRAQQTVSAAETSLTARARPSTGR